MNIYVKEIGIIYLVILGKRDARGHDTKILMGHCFVESTKYSRGVQYNSVLSCMLSFNKKKKKNERRFLK